MRPGGRYQRETFAMTITTDITHKHAGHIVAIEEHVFKANEAGQWNLTEIWKTLRLSKTKGPGKWAELKEAKRLTASGKVETVNGDKGGTWATKQATLRYAAWVSQEFEDMVFDAFEAVLEMPEIAQIVIQRMAAIGRERSAKLLERSSFNDKCDWRAMKRGPQSQTPAAKAHREHKAQQANLNAKIRRNISRMGC
jgi:hypothetical protein